jgi:hypothetical protein
MAPIPPTLVKRAVSGIKGLQKKSIPSNSFLPYSINKERRHNSFAKHKGRLATRLNMPHLVAAMCRAFNSDPNAMDYEYDDHKNIIFCRCLRCRPAAADPEAMQLDPPATGSFYIPPATTGTTGSWLPPVSMSMCSHYAFRSCLADLYRRSSLGCHGPGSTSSHPAASLGNTLRSDSKGYGPGRPNPRTNTTLLATTSNEAGNSHLGHVIRPTKPALSPDYKGQLPQNGFHKPITDNKPAADDWLHTKRTAVSTVPTTRTSDGVGRDPRFASDTDAEGRSPSNPTAVWRASASPCGSSAIARGDNGHIVRGNGSPHTCTNKRSQGRREEEGLLR